MRETYFTAFKQLQHSNRHQGLPKVPAPPPPPAPLPLSLASHPLSIHGPIVTCVPGNSFCTAIAITCADVCRILSNSGELSLVGSSSATTSTAPAAAAAAGAAVLMRGRCALLEVVHRRPTPPVPAAPSDRRTVFAVGRRCEEEEDERARTEEYALFGSRWQVGGATGVGGVRLGGGEEVYESTSFPNLVAAIASIEELVVGGWATKLKQAR